MTDWPAIAILRDEYYCLIVGAVRYALGRRSYVVGETIEIVQKYWSPLQEGHRETLIRDVREWLGTKGQRWIQEQDLPSVEAWRSLLTWMEAHKS